jgi:hypothetical protein
MQPEEEELEYEDVDESEESPDEPEGDMKNEEDPEYTITIEYKDFVTRFDLDEILSAIDRIIETEVLGYFDPDLRILRRQYPYGRPYWGGGDSELSFLGIKSVDAGSITLTVIVGGAVVAYVARRFKKGVDKSLFADEVERSGRMTGDVFGAVLGRVNDWAERYVPKQRELGGRVTKITAQRKHKSRSDKDAES